MIEMSTEIAALATALAKAQAEMGGAAKDAVNPAFRTKYATLEAVIDAAKPLAKYGIAFVQAPANAGDHHIGITTMLIHGESGQWIRSTLDVPLGKKDAQGVGSAISYGRRYSLMAVLGIAAEDDDGNAASTPAPRQAGGFADGGPVGNLRNSTKAENEADHIERLIGGCKTLTALADLWKTPMVQSALHAAPPEIADRLAAAKDARKNELQTKEAA